MEIKFVDTLPDKPRRGPQPHPVDAKIANELRSHPDVWAEFPRWRKKASSLSAFATSINRGQGTNPLCSGEFQATVRNKVMYVRYKNGVEPTDKEAVSQAFTPKKHAARKPVKKT